MSGVPRGGAGSDSTRLARDLADLGLRSGDRVVVHSSLRAVGPVTGGADAVVAALLDVLGEQGTLLAPTFTDGADDGATVDLATTPSRTGAISEALRTTPGAVRSDHPTHPVAAWGAEAQQLTAGHLAGRTLGPDSPLGRLSAGGGKVLLLGVGHTANTMIHVGEEHAGAPKPPPPEGLARVRVRCLDGRAVDHVLDTSPSCSAAFGALEGELRARAAIRDGMVGAALSQLMTGRAVVDAVVDLLARRPDALLCTRPGCGPCTRSRAALRRT